VAKAYLFQIREKFEGSRHEVSRQNHLAGNLGPLLGEMGIQNLSESRAISGGVPGRVPLRRRRPGRLVSLQHAPNGWLGEPKFSCKACGRRGADVRPDWQSVDA
jgi:hypothetical protein